jgi:preprotein translocase subunit SecA
MLQAVDYLWVEHLEAMEYLRNSVNLRAYGQRDPLVEYKKEGLKLFTVMEHDYAEHVFSNLPHIGAPRQFIAEQQAVARAAESITAVAQGSTKARSRVRMESKQRR